MKRIASQALEMLYRPFSILERIDVGETYRDKACICREIESFSILERIDVGETIWPAG